MRPLHEIKDDLHNTLDLAAEARQGVEAGKLRPSVHEYFTRELQYIERELDMRMMLVA